MVGVRYRIIDVEAEYFRLSKLSVYVLVMLETAEA